jgi:antitoxin HicB
MMKPQILEEYLNLPYHSEIIHDPDPDNPGWIAHVRELPGCITQADRFDELEEMIIDAMRGWLEIAILDGTPIPLPQVAEEYSGKFVVRIPRQLHRQLAEEAERQNVSLNLYVNYALALVAGGLISEQPEPLSASSLYHLSSTQPHQVREKDLSKQESKKELSDPN